MTNREIISRVRNTVKEHNVDSVLTYKHVYNILITNTSLLIKREADKKSIYMMSNIWQSACVEMIPVSSVTCTCIKFPFVCTIYRSKLKLPKFFETSSGFLAKSVTTLDNSIDITLTTPYQYEVKKKVKYNKEKYGFIEDGYLYTPNAEYPWIKIVGFFTEPPQSCGETKVCSNLNAIFPCPDYLIQPVVDMTLRELGMFKQVQFDHVENKNTIS
jgi:hypothetical protein